MAVDPKQFRQALGCYASGVTVVTAVDPVSGGDLGLTATAFCSVSLDPSLVLVCVAKGKDSWAVFSTAAGFVVNMLGDDQKDLSNRFAGVFPPGQDRFADIHFTRGDSSGAAKLASAICTLDCRRHSAFDGGDHTIFVGEVMEVEVRGVRDQLRPLLYFAGQYRSIGDTP